jgi:hypothetical protein
MQLSDMILGLQQTSLKLRQNRSDEGRAFKRCKTGFIFLDETRPVITIQPGFAAHSIAVFSAQRASVELNSMQQFLHLRERVCVCEIDREIERKEERERGRKIVGEKGACALVMLRIQA